jgi:hypothetical protein
MLDEAAAFATAASVLIGAVTWLVSHRREQGQARISHTADLIANISTSERLADANYSVTTLINSGGRPALADIEPELELHVVTMLDYYEYIAELCMRGVVDKPTVVSLRGNLMRRTWDACSRYIADTRERQRRLVYIEFERFVAALPADLNAFQPVAATGEPSVPGT